MRLKNKVAIVTGGASGFGEGIAIRFAKEGCKVVINDINKPGGEVVAKNVRSNGGEAIFVEGDISTNDGWNVLVSRTLEEYQSFNIVVNNAGFTHKNQSMFTVPEEEFDRIYSVNVKSLYWSVKNVTPVLENSDGAVMITVASVAGIRPRPGLTWYNGSKAAAIITSRSMAVELAPKKIRVNVINPVMGETAMLEDFMGMEDTPENREKFLSTIPLGRLARASDVANAALYLASDEAELITGACIEVDGGRTI